MRIKKSFDSFIFFRHMLSNMKDLRLQRVRKGCLARQEVFLRVGGNPLRLPWFKHREARVGRRSEDEKTKKDMIWSRSWISPVSANLDACIDLSFCMPFTPRRLVHRKSIVVAIDKAMS